MSKVYTANIARAKLVYNKKLEVYTIICAFNVTEKTERGTYKFPPRAKCDFVSGDFVYESIEQDKQRIMAIARSQLRTDHIEFV
jgi:hypothetical protein